jgi:sterol 3beta-glucosyltransferase
MRVLIVAAGTTGDVAPYTGLGARLRAGGHEVAIAAAEPFAAMVGAAGLEFRSLCWDPLALQRAEGRGRWRPGSGGALGGARLVRLLSEQLVELGEAMIRVARRGTDVILLAGLAYLAGPDVAEGLGVPSMGVPAMPAHPTGEFPPVLGVPSLGRWTNRTAGKLQVLGLSAAMSGAINQVRAKVGLASRSLAASMRARDAAAWPVCYGFSPTVVPRPADWRPGLEVVGYFWPERGHTGRVGGARGAERRGDRRGRARYR